jgi:hypothetical protein
MDMIYRSTVMFTYKILHIMPYWAVSEEYDICCRQAETESSCYLALGRAGDGTFMKQLIMLLQNLAKPGIDFWSVVV